MTKLFWSLSFKRQVYLISVFNSAIDDEPMTSRTAYSSGVAVSIALVWVSRAAHINALRFLLKITQELDVLGITDLPKQPARLS